MRAFKTVWLLVTLAVLLPGMAFAQGSLTGVVKDSSGAVLPGVTIEASSPVLIEKVRTATSDRNGQYRIIDLRGGTYTVTFTLTGFQTVKREAVTLSGETVVTVNADLSVGAVAETIVVTGEAPIVDIQSVTRQQVMSKEIMNALPTGRNYSDLGLLLTGVNTTRADTGGAMGDPMASLTIHGSKPSDQRVMQNGVNTMTLQAGGDIGIAVPNPGMASEVTVDTSGLSAELTTGGVRINYIPKDGGNKFSGTMFATFANPSLAGDNLTSDLIARGLTRANRIKKIYDLNPGVGGPIVKDRLWFYFTGRVNRADSFSGSFQNKNAYDPTSFTYVADKSKPEAYNQSLWQDAQLRLTWQATPKNKVAVTYDQQTRCSCPGAPFGPSPTTFPEATSNYRSPTQQLVHTEWSSPVTNKMMVELVGLHRTERWGFMPPSADVSSDFINRAQQSVLESGALVPVLDTTSGITYRGNFGGYNSNWVPNYYFRGAVSYVTGAHQLKAGFTDTVGFVESTNYNYSPYTYLFLAPGGFVPGVPVIISQNINPTHAKTDQRWDLGLFVQDRWTMKKLTLNLGLRYDGYSSGSEAQHVIGTDPLYHTKAPPRADFDLPKTDFNNWKDITPRFGATYDVTGDGKTAVKVSLNKYLASQTAGGQGSLNPATRIVSSATRLWFDDNGNHTPDCDLTSIGPSFGPDTCLGLSNPGFGKNNPNAANFDRDLEYGWGKRLYNWEFSAGVQREILPRVSVDVAYFRRWYGNFTVTDNTALSAADYTQFSITAPNVAGLPLSGQKITGLFDVNRTVTTTNLTSLVSAYGVSQYEHWNGLDISVNARLRNGMFLFGGVNTGRTYTNNCEIGKLVPESLTVGGGPGGPPAVAPLQFCSVTTPFLTQVKLNGSYTIPKADVIVSATLQNAPGLTVAGNLTLSGTPGTLGRPLTNGSLTVALVEPGSLHGDRVNQVDLRVGKIIRVAGTRTSLNLDLFNVFNSSPVTAENGSINSVTNTFRQPTAIAQARFAKIGVQFEF